MEKRKRKCCVEACNSEEERSFHLIPRNVEMSEKWKEVINIKKDISIKTKYLYVCGRHFTNKCFKEKNKTRTRLRNGTIPSLFLGPQQQESGIDFLF